MSLKLSVRNSELESDGSMFMTSSHNELRGYVQDIIDGDTAGIGEDEAAFLKELAGS